MSTETFHALPLHLPKSHTTTSEETRKCGFLDLSAELRNMIYREALVFNDGLNMDVNGNARGQRSRLQVAISLLSTCKQVRKEASCVLYGENDFRFRTCCGWSTLKSFLKNIGEVNRGLITHMTLPLNYKVNQIEVEEVMPSRRRLPSMMRSSPLPPCGEKHSPTLASYNANNILAVTANKADFSKLAALHQLHSITFIISKDAYPDIDLTLAMLSIINQHLGPHIQKEFVFEWFQDVFGLWDHSLVEWIAEEYVGYRTRVTILDDDGFITCDLGPGDKPTVRMLRLEFNRWVRVWTQKQFWDDSELEPWRKEFMDFLDERGLLDEIPEPYFPPHFPPYSSVHLLAPN